jgi:hypothetical protein
MADELTFSGVTWDILEEKYGIRPRTATSSPTARIVDLSLAALAGR